MMVRLLLLVCIFTAPAYTAEKSPPRFDEIQALLNRKCVRCHSGEKKRADLDLSTLQGLRIGGESGPVITPGDSEKSLLFEKIHKGEMPPNRRLTKDQESLIKHWIEEEAQSDFAKAPTIITQHQIEPILRLRCTVCHGLRQQEGGLDLRSKASMLKGGKSGPALVLGDPKKSLLLKRIHAEEMPPRNRLLRFGVKPMPANEVEMLTQWIKDGAPEVKIKPDIATAKGDPLVTENDRKFWSFQPPREVSIPRLSSERIHNPIDAFVLRRLQKAGLSFAKEADRVTLLRRATFDLTGLPPTPEEAQRFLNDPSPDAYEQLIERLLASPRYGERWGRYWLDLVGYADSEGKRSADPIRPHAWRYRDYVIRSLNADKSYARFLMEQIAGDELADYRKGTITQEVMDNLIATGFLRMAPDGTGSDVVNSVPERLEVISDQIQILGSSVLGLTLHCARCHTHKYDPIPQRDYYRLMATFKGAYDEHDWLKPSFVPGQTKSKKPGRVLAMVSKEEAEKWNRYVKRLNEEIAVLKKKKQDRDTRLQLRALQAVASQKPMIRALWDRGTPSPTYIYRRGDYLQPGKLVGPGTLSMLTDGRTPFKIEKPYPGAKSTGRRLALAKWLTKPDHALTSRVMVNRIWKHHFGQGIVKTLSNFGKTGAKPTHPDLLDWLARRFVAKDWSIKAMHRLMMTSSTYRQSSEVTEEHERLDMENALLSRMPMQRMQAEVLRDSLLQISGQLSQSPFGPPDPVSVRKDGLVTALKGPEGWRRSIYVRQRRSQIPTLLENFDLPQMNPNCVRRTDSTVASQALHLMNNATIEKLASHFAQRLLREAGDNPELRIERAYLLTLSRKPSESELRLNLRILSLLEKRWAEHLTKKGLSTGETSHKALTSWCHTLFCSAGLLYID